jgi:alkylation response protein AidB-like acyl-CoA dehydrogenase
VNFALSDEQEFLREAARGALSRFKTVEEAREALEGGTPSDLWPTACEAGWTGLMISEEHGGAGLGPMDAMLVFEELGRVLASVPLLGHVPATFLLDHAEGADADLLAALASGGRRAAFVPARPPDDLEPGWTVEPEKGLRRIAAPEIADDGTVSGTVAWVPDAPGADVLVVVGDDGRAALVEGADTRVEGLWRYDATRSVGHVTFDGAPGTLLDLDPDTVAAGWYLAQTLIAAESLGVSDLALHTSVQYAKERFTFGRAIGSYQAVKHQLVEILRLADNARSLMYYAGWAGADAPGEFPVAASAFRSSAGRAIEFATRAQINVHGGIGATWEHDAPLFFRRAQLSRRLLGGTADAAARVADELFAAARADAALTEVPAAAPAQEAGATLA